MKDSYVRLMRGLRVVMRRTGLLALLDRHARRSRWGRWMRSLLAIYDLDDMVGLSVPWWTFRAADLVDAQLRERPRARVLEWGSGASTMWLSARAAEVHSIEHDEEWGGRLLAYLPTSATLHLAPPVPAVRPAMRSRKRGFEDLDFTSYVEGADTLPGVFDVVVIDGRAREACLGRAVGRLAEDGVVVMDNVERRRYRKAIRELGDGYVVHWTWGLTPALPYPSGTAVIRRSGLPDAPGR